MYVPFLVVVLAAGAPPYLAVLVLAYTAGGMLAPAAGGLMLQWTPGLGFPALLLGVATLGLWRGNSATDR